MPRRLVSVVAPLCRRVLVLVLVLILLARARHTEDADACVLVLVVGLDSIRRRRRASSCDVHDVKKATAAPTALTKPSSVSS